MGDTSQTLKKWTTFAGCVLVVAVLYWAQDVLVPLALATLLTFVLTPPVVWLERRIGHVAAVLTTVALVFTLLGLAGWGVARQLDHLADDLPQYRANILNKIADVRGAQHGGPIEKLQRTIDDIQKQLGSSTATKPKGSAANPVVVASESPASATGFAWLGSFVHPLGTAGLVITLVIFMLLERRDLRDRLLGIGGRGRLALTTRALDEAGRRVSRQLLMQSLVNTIYGTIAFVGLHAIGVPYALVWAALGAALRFIPYVGPVLGAGAPVLVSLAALPGWIGPLLVLGMYIVLELLTNLVFETILYADAAGVSQVALLVSVAFWTWLWGPLGLLMATPLTVCLVVLGKHVPALEFMSVLMADAPPLAPEYGYYQRLLAHDMAEAADLVEGVVVSETPEQVFDSLLLPALNYAERDRLEQRLSPGEEDAVVSATRELLAEAIAAMTREVPAPAGTEIQTRTPLRVLAYPANGVADELALEMLGHLLADLPIAMEIVGTRLLASDLVRMMREQSIHVVCFGDLPPSPPSKTRYIIKRLRAALPEAQILVGRWAPAELADPNPEQLREAGANLVSSTLIETTARVRDLIGTAPAPVSPPAPEPAPVS